MGNVINRRASSWVRTPDLFSPLYPRSSSLAASPAVTHGADKVRYSASRHNTILKFQRLEPRSWMFFGGGLLHLDDDS